MFRKFGLHAVLIVSCLVIIFFPMLREKPDAEKAEKAMAASTQFLKLVDTAQYDTSWQEGAGLLKEKITQKEWAEKLTKINSIYGPLVERKHEKSTYTTSAKDSPDGEYIILIYETNFKNKASTTETVIATFEKDNFWRVAGYHIR